MNFLKDIFSIFFPKLCICCNEHLLHNNIICLKCSHDLPLTNFSFEKNNLVEKSFWGRVKIENATSLFYFEKKGSIQKIIHQLKYNNHQEIGEYFGNWLGEEMLQSKRFQQIDYIIPVPLHKTKLKKRGYNQVTKFGENLAKILQTSYNETFLTKISFTKTQTKKMRFDRWKNTQHVFHIQNSKELENKHILLIDDIITTGATIESCCFELSTVKNLKISIATMAYTK